MQRPYDGCHRMREVFLDMAVSLTWMDRGLGLLAVYRVLMEEGFGNKVAQHLL